MKKLLMIISFCFFSFVSYSIPITLYVLKYKGKILDAKTIDYSHGTRMGLYGLKFRFKSNEIEAKDLVVLLKDYHISLDDDYVNVNVSQRDDVDDDYLTITKQVIDVK